MIPNWHFKQFQFKWNTFFNGKSAFTDDGRKVMT
jgi:hypothetical protein